MNKKNRRKLILNCVAKSKKARIEKIVKTVVDRDAGLILQPTENDLEDELVHLPGFRVAAVSENELLYGDSRSEDVSE